MNNPDNKRRSRGKSGNIKKVNSKERKNPVDTNFILHERIKELNCLYGISEIVEKSGGSLERIITGAVKLIPPSWRYPEITCAKITVERRDYATKNFRKTKYIQSADIKVGEKEGWQDRSRLSQEEAGT